MPISLIQTGRLTLREFLLEDAEEMFRLNADPEVVRYTGDGPFESVETAREFLKDYDQYEKTGFGRWTVVLKETGEMLGWCGLRRLDDGYIDLGYRFHREHWGKGYATESCSACVKYGFTELDMDLIIGRVDPENKVSARVLEKIGMTYWKQDLCHHVMADIYRLRRADWAQD